MNQLTCIAGASKSLTLIGDVHGKFSAYESICAKHDRTIQVGDFGIGFGIEPPICGANHMFIRGNHDHPQESREHISYLGDYGYLKEDKLFYLSGAFSVDRQWRTPGLTWWYDEELSEPDLQAALWFYKEAKPEVMVTHMLPHNVQQAIFHFKPSYPCRTSLTLKAMFKVHAPRIWVCGHYHLAKDVRKGKTRFVVLPELGTVTIPLPLPTITEVS
jgi:Icc-related predicted phosphoesterase